MKQPLLRVASCQFSVEADIEHNRRSILAQIAEAAARGARVVHFCETALSGYAGVDIFDTSQLDWAALFRATEDVCRAAAKHRVWVLLGSTHRLSDGHLPHNSVYVISDEGRVVDRYDKRFCTGTASEVEPEQQPYSHDLSHYTPGDRAVVFDVDGFRCSTLVCYDYRFPELYRDLKQRGVEVLFQSFHNARRDQETFERRNIWRDVVPATMMCHAATNYLWISATNSTTQYSLWPSFFVRPDGLITGRLAPHEPGVLISEVRPTNSIWDAARPWRQRAIEGCLHSGTTIDDERSSDRTCF